MRHINRLIIVLSLLTVASAAQADNYFPNYFTVGENDTLRITTGSDTVTVPVRAHFEGRVSRWNLTLTWPEGLEGIKASEGPGMMAIPYLDSQGEECTYDAVVAYSSDLTTITSIIGVTGYWPYGGGYIAYGLATWEAGDYEMLYLTFKVSEGFTSGTLHIDGLLVGDDPRGGGVGNGVLFYRPVTVVVTRAPGDVNGDGEVTIADVTTLINRLLTGTASVDIDDVDGDGQAGIADVTALINLLLTRP